MLPLVSAYWEFESLTGFDAEKVSSQLERLLSDSRLGAGWIAIEGEVPVGYLLAVYVFSLEHLGITAEIDEFFVVPDNRHSGTGSGLLLAAETEFTELGCTNVSLQISRENDSARRFYLRHGYVGRSKYDLLDKDL